MVVVFSLAPSDFDAADGNLIVDPPESERDWESLGIICPDGPGVGDGCSVDEPTGQDDNAFGIGAKEDTPDPAVVSGSIPNNKSDLLRFYIWYENFSAKDFLYLGWVRVSDPSGTTNMDFELNQNKCEYDGLGSLVEGSICSANEVTPERTAGDILIKYDLSQGGTVPDLGYHIWLTEAYALEDPDIPDSAGDACEANNKFPCWGTVQQLELNDNFEGSLNDPDPVYDPIVDVTLDPRTFGEAAINLTDSGIFPASKCINYGSAYLKSRSSDSFTAELKDFIAPIPVSIGNCGAIKVIKDADPEGPQIFSFTLSGPNVNEQFDLDDNPASELANEWIKSDLSEGTYTLTETSIEGWKTGVSCVSSIGDNESADNIELDLGETVTCTFMNQKDSFIIVEKQTDPAGSDKEFPFQTSWLGDGSEEYDFTLTDNEQHNSGDLEPGTYSVGEVVPGGWDLKDVICTSSKGDEETEDNISLQAGETITCVFNNQQDSFIIVEKQTTPADSEREFPFQASWLGDGSEDYDFMLTDNQQHNSGDLDPGTYSVIEILPTGWQLKDIVCTSSNGDEETAESISLQAGETVTCIFYNEMREFRLTTGYEDLAIDNPTMDYDYNDWETQIDIVYSESTIDFMIEPLGRGGVLSHVFHIDIPAGTIAGNGEYTLTVYDQNGTPIGTETGEFVGSVGKDFTVIPCTCDAFPPVGTVVNVYEGSYEPTQRTASLSIVLDEPEPNMEDLFDDKVGNHGEGLFFDPYLYVDKSGEEVHQADFRMLTVQLERSDPAWKWPEEHVCLTNAYQTVTGNPPDFTYGEEWWKYPSVNGCTYGDGKECELDDIERTCKLAPPTSGNPVFLPLILR